MRIAERLRSFLRPKPTLTWSDLTRMRSHVVGPEHREDFRRFGCRRRRAFFPHRVRFLPKAPLDGLFLARCGTEIDAPAALWTVTIHVEPPTLDEFPPQLFFDDDLVWHRQHLGQPGHVACASVAVHRGELILIQHWSDIVQRADRVPAYRTRINERLSGWHVLSFHALAHLGVRLGLKTLRTPGGELALSWTDRARDTKGPLFQRVYERSPARDFGAQPAGEWWRFDLERLGPRLIPMATEDEPVQPGSHPTVCLYHDIERGVGHREVDPGFARRVEERGWEPLERVLEAEAGAGVTGTYGVVGMLLPEVAERIRARGHEVAFHSYDHGPGPQLARCRDVDYRIRGYRPPQSRLTDEHTSAALARRNVEWFASGAGSLGIREPELWDGIARIPIALDDFPLHTGAMDYATWEARVLNTVAEAPFTAIGLHDCYSDHWIGDYPALLERLKGMARLRRVGDVANDLFLGAGI